MKVKAFTVQQARKGIKSASGKVLKLSDYLSYERYQKMLEFELELYFPTGYEGMMKLSQRGLEFFNSGQFAEVGRIFLQMQEGSYENLTNQPAHVKIAALVLNYEDEDETRYSESLMEEKIEDLRVFDSNSFFYLVASTVPGFKENCLNTLGNQKEVEATEV